MDELVLRSSVDDPPPDSRTSNPLPVLKQGLRVLLVLALLLSTLMLSPATHAEDGVYVVQQGDSLGSIARQLNVSISELASKNGITNLNIIHPGQRLVIPGSRADAALSMSNAALPGGDGYHTVARGDTLASVSQRHGISVNDVMRLNGLTNPNFISVGQRLRVSARAEALTMDEKLANPQVADSIHVVQAEETLESIADEHNTSVQELLVANGLPNASFVWVGQKLRVNKPLEPGENLGEDAPVDGLRWIEVNLSNQTLTAWQGNVPVLHTYVSTGTAATPTVTGRYPIYMKLTSQHMTGPGYSLPGVPWVMYFFQGYAIHGTYWHSNYGTPMSHGCVNMRTSEAQFLFNWASEGTEVYVHY